jgi:hypothetical protein
MAGRTQGLSEEGLWQAIACIAAVISRFDVVADQAATVNGSQSCTKDRVQPSGLVGEIVLPPVGEDPARQFPGTPYAASFTLTSVEFTLASVHILWRKNALERLPEITEFAAWMHDWAVRPMDWNSNLIGLDDFNLDRIGDPLRCVHLHWSVAVYRAEHCSAHDLRR